MAVPAILQQLGNTQTQTQTIPPQLRQLKQMLGTLRNAGNPYALLNQYAQQNPAMQQAMQYVQQNGGNPKAAAEQLARERGADISSMLSALR